MSVICCQFLKVLNGHIVASHRVHPPVSGCIEVRGCHNVSEWVVISSHGERSVPEVFPNWSVTAHLRARNSNFDEWYFFSPPFSSWLA